MRAILTLFIVGALATLALASAGRGVSGSDPGSGPSIVVTTPQAADMARNVAGGAASVTQILPANADPHEYEPRPSDAAALATADLIVRSGGEVDAWLDQLIDASGSDAPVLTLADHVRLIDGPDGADPHWWQDPRNGILAVAAIRSKLDENDPARARRFDSGARRYTAELQRLDAAIAACVDRVPVAERKLVTGHDALDYFARRYRIALIGAAIPALSTQAQASAGETADLVGMIRSAGVRAVFPEAGVSAGLEESIAGEAGVGVGGELWADTLGPAGSAAATYAGSLAANARTVVAGLSGGAVDCRIGTP
ncbi:MAG: metal ABC transporter substrate-binding protein [Solirubrobacterales bacterium]